MTRIRTIVVTLAAASALGAGAAGATTIISGTNSVRVHQSGGGTTIVEQPGFASHGVTGGVVLRHAEPLVVHEVTPMRDEPRPFSFSRLFFFLMPWAAPEPAPFVAPHVNPRVEPRVAPEPAHEMFHRVSGENRAVRMMDTIMSRMNR